MNQQQNNNQGHRHSQGFEQQTMNQFQQPYIVNEHENAQTIDQIELEGVKKVTLLIDEEALKILEDASPIFSESIVSMGIKLFAKSEAYKNFMMTQEAKQSIIDDKLAKISNLSSVTEEEATTIVEELYTEAPLTNQSIEIVPDKIPSNQPIAQSAQQTVNLSGSQIPTVSTTSPETATPVAPSESFQSW